MLLFSYTVLERSCEEVLSTDSIAIKIDIPSPAPCVGCKLYIELCNWGSKPIDQLILIPLIFTKLVLLHQH